MTDTLPYFFSVSLTRSARLMKNLRYRCAPPEPLNPKRSCPDPADTSAAARAGTFCTGTWSTVTAILFFSPQALAKLSNQVSYAGTKWLHCTIESDLSAASDLEMNGAESKGAVPAAASVRPVDFKNRRRVTDPMRFLLILVSSSVVLL